MTFSSEEMERARRVAEAEKIREAKGGSGQAAEDRRVPDAGIGPVRATGRGPWSHSFALDRADAGGGAGPGVSAMLGDIKFGLSGTFTEPQPAADLPVELQVEAIHGFRLARLVARDSSVVLKSLHHDFELQPEAMARCMGKWTTRTTPLRFMFRPAPPVERCASAPDPKCHCGFYAVKERDDLKVRSVVDPSQVAIQPQTKVIELEVELSGRMIVHEKGIRGQHQRILTLWLPGRCEASWLCEGSPAFLHFGKKRVRAMCSECAKEHREARLASPAQLTARLGVETRWRQS